ncbi:MAG: hypothetical protein Fur0041_03820 [Bacteroidia bacterium]
MQAQQFIPNAGFESWGATAGEPQQPQGWISGNLFASPLFNAGNPTFVSAAGAPDNYQGNYSLKIETKTLVQNPDTNTIPNTFGYCMTGTFSLASPYIRPGYAFTSRPMTFSYYTKYTPVNGDTAYCWVVLTKWNGSFRDTIAVGGDYLPSAVSSYTLRTVNLVYNTAQANAFPDSCLIWFSSSGENPQVGSKLFVDALAFTGYVGINDKNILNGVDVYPNPSSSFTYVDVNTDAAKEVVVFDMSGREVGRYNFDNKKAKIDSWAMAAGVYTYAILNNEKEVMNRGKFSVAK